MGEYGVWSVAAQGAFREGGQGVSWGDGRGRRQGHLDLGEAEPWVCWLFAFSALLWPAVWTASLAPPPSASSGFGQCKALVEYLTAGGGEVEVFPPSPALPSKGSLPAGPWALQWGFLLRRPPTLPGSPRPGRSVLSLGSTPLFVPLAVEVGTASLRLALGAAPGPAHSSEGRLSLSLKALQ